MNYLKHIFKKHLISVLSLGFLIVFAVTLHIFAAPPPWPYAPGATLNPGCEPTDPTCIVKGGWLLTGNAGTLDDGTYFIGTTDNIPLNFRVNNVQAGRIEKIDDMGVGGNTFLGYQAGNYNTGNSSSNSFFGYQAGFLNTGGSYNTASGYNALYSNTVGHTNTAIGYNSLYFNTDGQENIAIGSQAQQNNINSNYNIAIGNMALEAQSYSPGKGGFNSNNIAIGHQSLANNNSTSINNGINNVAIGVRSMYNNGTGYDDIAYGFESLYSNTTGSSNTAIGNRAGYSNSTGSGNVFLGYQAGYNELGSNKLYIANSSTTTPLIYGDFGTNDVTVNGNLTVTGTCTGCGAGGGASYKVYTALLTQTGTDAPVATVLENTLGGDIVWSYVEVGVYYGTLEGAFPYDRTFFLMSPHGTRNHFIGYDSDDDVIVTTNNNGVQEDGDLNNTSIEIRVYNP
jgi:hypothetical protein